MLVFRKVHAGAPKRKTNIAIIKISCNSKTLSEMPPRLFQAVFIWNGLLFVRLLLLIAGCIFAVIPGISCEIHDSAQKYEQGGCSDKQAGSLKLQQDIDEAVQPGNSTCKQPGAPGAEYCCKIASESGCCHDRCRKISH